MLTVGTILKFLAFDADAIRTIASSRKATWIGLLFVISAGFAREYDGEYLFAEPWHLLIPVAASLIGCFFMVLFVHGLAWCRGDRDVPVLEVFRGFLNLYWMTAPLAWLYAIPVERFFDPGSATSANLTLLGIVAVWRVVLMVRCVQVLYRVHPVAAFFPVILLGIFDKRTNREGAIAGMLVGLLFTGTYIAGCLAHKIFPVSEPFFEPFYIAPEGIGTIGCLLNFIVTYVVSRLTPPPPEHIQRFVENVRIPSGAGEATH